MEQYLLSQIHAKINPYFTARKGLVSALSLDKKMYIKERCTTEEFVRMFPEAKRFEEPPAESVPLRKKNKFAATKKFFEQTFNDLRVLDSVFGSDWDVAFNGTAVGFVLAPISFRLLSTKINSHKTALCEDLEGSFLVQSSSVTSFTSISVTLFRSSISRWGPWDENSQKFKESAWEETIAKLQRENPQICKNRLRHNKVK